MMNQAKFNWDYSEKSDILNIHKLGKNVSGSAELGDFTIDFDAAGSVVGIEVMNAADFFSRVGFTKEQLSNLQNAEIAVTQKKNSVLIVWVTLRYNDVEHTVPLPAPVVAEQNSASMEA